MVPNGRNRIGNYHILQRRAVQECDGTYRLDTLTPVDRLQGRTVVEEPVSITAVQTCRIGIIPILCFTYVSRGYVLKPWDLLDRIAYRY